MLAGSNKFPGKVFWWSWNFFGQEKYADHFSIGILFIVSGKTKKVALGSFDCCDWL